MQSKRVTALAGLCAVLAASTVSSAARAQQTSSETTEEETIPSRAMLGSGVVTFGLSYGSAVVVGATSSRPEDHHLFIPLAGPWVDLVNRGDCGGLTGRSCDTETTYKVLLVVDGLFQGLGALAIVDAFLTPERHVVTRTAATPDRPRVRVAPGGVGTGYGMLAVGSF
jgi:hypothetical protein